METAVRSILVARSPIPLFKRVALLFVLLAFVAQGYILQTPIHHFTVPTSGTVVSDATHTPSGKTPPVDVSGCRLCQQTVHGGALLAASEVSVLASLNFVTTSLLASGMFVGAVAPVFAWQSRAPPRH